MAQTDLTHLSRETLSQRLAYDPLTGHFTWLESPRAGWAGRRAGYAMNNGYRMISIDNQPVLEHRLAWFLMTGEWPAGEIDHDNRIRNDNRFANLKDGTKADNQANASVRSDTSSGHQGINWNARAKGWACRLQRHGHRYFLGYFNSVDDALRARQEKRDELSI